MAKIEIIDCCYDVIKEIPNVMTLFHNLFGDGTIALYSVLVDDKLNFVGRSGNNCALVSDEGYTLFELKDENLFSITRDDYLVYVDDCCFVEDSGIQHSLDFFKVQEDVEGYDGCISYKQYNPSNDTLITITYQQMYNDREQGDKIYSCHTVDIDRVYIDERFQELGRVDYGFVPKRAKYFHKLEVDSDMVGYKLAALKEYGFFKYLMNGAEALEMLVEGDFEGAMSKYN